MSDKIEDFSNPAMRSNNERHQRLIKTVEEHKINAKIVGKTSTDTVISIDGKRLTIPSRMLVEDIKNKAANNEEQLFEIDQRIHKLSEQVKTETRDIHSLLSKLQNDVSILSEEIFRIRREFYGE